MAPISRKHEKDSFQQRVIVRDSLFVVCSPVSAFQSAFSHSIIKFSNFARSSNSMQQRLSLPISDVAVLTEKVLRLFVQTAAPGHFLP